MMLDVGFQLTFQQVGDSVKRWKALAVGVLTNAAVVPLLAFLILTQLPLPIGLSATVFTALALTGVSPGAPIAPKMIQLAKGDLAYGSLLMLGCQLVSIFSAPLLATWILPGAATEGVSVTGVILSLIALLLVPLSIGMAARHKLGEKVLLGAKVAQTTTGVIFITVFFILVFTQPEIFTSIGILEWLFMGVVVVAYGAVSLPAPGLTTKERIALVITSGERNFALAMVMAAKGFGGADALGGVLALAALSTPLGFIISLWLGRRPSASGKAAQ